MTIQPTVVFPPSGISFVAVFNIAPKSREVNRGSLRNCKEILPCWFALCGLIIANRVAVITTTEILVSRIVDILADEVNRAVNEQELCATDVHRFE